jgi:hypothetical protein
MLGITKLIEKLKTWTPKYPEPSHIHPKSTLLSLYQPSELFSQKIAAEKMNTANQSKNRNTALQRGENEFFQRLTLWATLRRH